MWGPGLEPQPHKYLMSHSQPFGVENADLLVGESASML